MSDTVSFMTEDGLNLYTRAWVPSGSTQANVVLIHGYGDHSGRYEDLARVLNNSSLAVYSYDQRGFGRSDGRRGYIARFDALLEDLDLFLQHIAPAIQDHPVFMLGQSMGGLLVIRYAETRQPALSGLVLCSPLLAFSDKVPKALLSLGRYIARVAPWLPVSNVDAQGLSHFPEVVEAADTDPLSYHKAVHARTGAEMQNAVTNAFRDVSRLALPFYLAHGGADAIVPPSGSKRFVDNCPVSDKTLRIYKDGYHELWHDLESESFTHEICAWIHERL